MERVQSAAILKDLKRKMVLITGPRQVGKTFLAKQLAKSYQHPLYLNFDNLQDRNVIHDQSWLFNTDLLILDEIHKMPDWKNYVKGIYDTKAESMHLLVTGSARLEIFNHIGDSLAGRYFLHRLMPLSCAELKQLNKAYDINNLIDKSGFPEPYLIDDLTEVNRWRLQYVNSLLATDVFDFDKIQNIQAIRTLFELLKNKVGSPISYQSLAEDIAISPITVKKYIEILEALYIIFRITPFSKNIARSLLKEPKIYFFDSGLLQKNEGAQLENIVAVSLLKHVFAKIDYQAENYALHYLRTKDKEEVDFALIKDDAVQQIIEVKASDKEVSKSLYTFHKKYNLPATQLVKNIRLERMVDNIKVQKAENFLADLML